jgi:hypothetical protein
VENVKEFIEGKYPGIAIRNSDQNPDKDSMHDEGVHAYAPESLLLWRSWHQATPVIV